MNSNQLFDQAMYAFSTGDIQYGKRLLKQSADLKLPIAVLYHAEHLFREDPDKGLSYLLNSGNEGVKGALHRYVVLKVFFTEKGLTIDDLALLHKEAMLGHVESLLILLNLTYQLSDSDIYRKRLQAIEPELVNKLNINCSDYFIGDEIDFKNMFVFAVSQWVKRTSTKPSVTVSKINMAIYNDVVTPLICDYFALRLTPKLEPSLVHDPVSGKAIKNKIRNSSIVNVEPDLLDWFTLELELLIEIFTGDPRQNGESLNFISYEVDQEYKPHYDAIVGDGDFIKKVMSDGGQRKRTAITYLTDDMIGGETVFPRLGVTYKPCKGSLLIFDNICNDDKVLQDSYHAGRPVVKGHKLILTKWLRCKQTQYGDMVYVK